jgi:hypothetical protein
VIPSLILIALLIAGTEVLRRQAITDFPEETWERRSERLRASMARVGHREARAPEAVSGDERLQQLERLAKLREAGVLSPEELEREKARILARA